MAVVNFYSFYADWYDEYDNKDMHSNGIVAATSLTEAVEKIEKRLPYTDNLHIQALDDCDFIFLNREHYDLIQREGLGAFDVEEEFDDLYPDDGRYRCI